MVGGVVWASDAPRHAKEPGLAAAAFLPAGDPGKVEKGLKEAEKRTEARRQAVREAAEEAGKKGDQAAAAGHYLELISLPNPTLSDCRLAIKALGSAQDWRSLAKAHEVTAKAMQAIIAAPPESFTRPAPEAPPGAREFGATVEVQTDLDGVWHKAKGTAEGWRGWIERKQRQMKGERFRVLCKLAELYRDRLKEPAKAVPVLRESLADVPFFTIPLEKLIAEEWPAKERKIDLSIELGVHLPAARDLVTLLEGRGELDAALELQSRVVLASYSWGGLPYEEIEKLWSLLRKCPAQSPLPRVAWLHVLSPQRPSVEFDLDKFQAPRPDHKLSQLSIVPRPGLAFDSLELTADMEAKGGYVQVWCSTLRGGKQASLGEVKWHEDQRKGREPRTATFRVPEGTGVIYFHRAWRPGTDPDGVEIHRIAVKATFRKDRPDP
jgi:hypothetical protein